MIFDVYLTRNKPSTNFVSHYLSSKQFFHHQFLTVSPHSLIRFYQLRRQASTLKKKNQQNQTQPYKQEPSKFRGFLLQILQIIIFV